MSSEALLVMAGMVSFSTSVPSCEYHDEPRQVPSAIPVKLHDRLDGEWVGETRLGSVSVWFSFVVSDRRVTGRSMLDAHPSIGAVKMIGKDVRFDFPKGSVAGRWSHADDAISGTLIQAGGKPVSIRLLRHPQTPVPPYHYDHYEITFSGDQRVRLKGTVTVPFAARGVPGVVLVVGSSPADRDYVGLGATPAHRPYAVLADYLSRHGIAVLRYDERGVSRSEGDFWNASADMLATDVGNAVRTLASRPGVDSARVGVIGHSAGALLAVKLLAMPSPASFGMALNMPTSSGVRYASSQIEARARHRGIDPLARAKSVDATIAVNAAVLKAAPTADASMRANAALASVSSEAGRNLTALNTAAEVSSGLYKYMLMHDPIDDLRRVVHPLLVVEGGSDRFVEGKASIERVNAVHRSVYLRTCLLPKLGHDLRDVDVRDGKEPEGQETISKGLLAMIEHWIKRVSL